MICARLSVGFANSWVSWWDNLCVCLCSYFWMLNYNGWGHCGSLNTCHRCVCIVFKWFKWFKVISGCSNVNMSRAWSGLRYHYSPYIGQFNGSTHVLQFCTRTHIRCMHLWMRDSTWLVASLLPVFEKRCCWRDRFLYRRGDYEERKRKCVEALAGYVGSAGPFFNRSMVGVFADLSHQQVC